MKKTVKTIKIARQKQKYKETRYTHLSDQPQEAHTTSQISTFFGQSLPTPKCHTSFAQYPHTLLSLQSP